MNVFRLAILTSLFFVAGTSFSASDMVAPKPSSAILPVYPETARNARVEGVVKLWFVVNADGEVIKAGIISGNPLLRGAATDAVKSWRFPTNTLQPNIRRETEFVYVLKVQSKKGEPRITVSMIDFRRIEITSELYVKAIE